PLSRQPSSAGTVLLGSLRERVVLDQSGEAARVKIERYRRHRADSQHVPPGGALGTPEGHGRLAQRDRGESAWICVLLPSEAGASRQERRAHPTQAGSPKIVMVATCRQVTILTILLTRAYPGAGPSRRPGRCRRLLPRRLRQPLLVP